jgi:hypothetical protein
MVDNGLLKDMKVEVQYGENISKYDQSLFILKSNGSCLESYDCDNKQLFFLCKNCICKDICGLDYRVYLNENYNGTKRRMERLKLANQYLREKKIERILRDE